MNSAERYRNLCAGSGTTTPCFSCGLEIRDGMISYTWINRTYCMMCGDRVVFDINQPTRTRTEIETILKGLDIFNQQNPRIPGPII